MPLRAASDAGLGRSGVMSKAAGDATPGALQAPGVSGFPSFLQAAGTPNPAPGTTVPPLSHTGRALVRGSAGREGGVHCSGGRTSAPSGAAGQVSAGAGREGARAFPSPAHSGVQVSLSPAISWIPSSRPWDVALSLTLVHGDSQRLAWLGSGHSGRGDCSPWSQAEQRERPNDVSASSRCHHEMTQEGWRKEQTVISHSSKGDKSQVKVLAEQFLPGLQTATSLLRPDVAFTVCLERELSGAIPLFSLGTQCHRIGAPSLRPHLTLITSSRVLTPNTISHTGG